MTKQKLVWVCSGCGYSQPKWSGSCVSCSEWNTFVEEIVSELKKSALRVSPSTPIAIAEIDLSESPRMLTNIKQLDRLAGGGIVPGSLILFGGNPGIGKSTLLLQICAELAKQGKKILYVCGEESTQQTSLRARRLGAMEKNLYLLSETLFEEIERQVEQVKPDVLVIDSIQIVYKGEIPSSPGSVTQVREVAASSMHIAKKLGVTVFVIGHVTKSGEIAGPRVLEHLVDTVFDFEGDRHHGFRMLRAIKNRFGPTDDVAIFQMGEKGLVEVDNPSQVFLEERMREVSGSVILPSVEGSRSFLVEVQALTSHSPFPTPSRRTSGFDQNRLALLLAVLEKRVGYQLHNCDVFVSIAGGMKIYEPAADLAVALSIASSFSTKPIDPDTVVLGEIGLSGEVRGVSRIESRLKEAIRMGCKRCVFPKKNLKGLPSSFKQKIQLIGIDLVDEAIHGLIL